MFLGLAGFRKLEVLLPSVLDSLFDVVLLQLCFHPHIVQLLLSGGFFHCVVPPGCLFCLPSSCLPCAACFFECVDLSVLEDRPCFFCSQFSIVHILQLLGDFYLHFLPDFFLFEFFLGFICSLEIFVLDLGVLRLGVLVHRMTGRWSVSRPTLCSSA